MTQKDYILRQIELLGAALIAIRKKILGGEVEAGDVEAQLQEVSQKGGMALDLAKAASPETLRMLIAPTGEIEPGGCWLLAETLYLDGLQAKQLGDEGRARDSLSKAKMLFSVLAPMGAFLVGFAVFFVFLGLVVCFFGCETPRAAPPPPLAFLWVALTFPLVAAAWIGERHRDRAADRVNARGARISACDGHVHGVGRGGRHGRSTGCQGGWPSTKRESR